MIILLTLIIISLGNIWILLGENWCWSLLGLKGLNNERTNGEYFLLTRAIWNWELKVITYILCYDWLKNLTKLFQPITNYDLFACVYTVLTPHAWISLKMWLVHLNMLSQFVLWQLAKVMSKITLNWKVLNYMWTANCACALTFLNGSVDCEAAVSWFCKASILL